MPCCTRRRANKASGVTAHSLLQCPHKGIVLKALLRCCYCCGGGVPCPAAAAVVPAGGAAACSAPAAAAGGADTSDTAEWDRNSLQQQQQQNRHVVVGLRNADLTRLAAVALLLLHRCGAWMLDTTGRVETQPQQVTWLHVQCRINPTTLTTNCFVFCRYAVEWMTGRGLGAPEGEDGTVTTLLRVLVLRPVPELPTRDRFLLLGGTGRPALRERVVSCCGSTCCRRCPRAPAQRVLKRTTEHQSHTFAAAKHRAAGRNRDPQMRHQRRHACETPSTAIGTGVLDTNFRVVMCACAAGACSCKSREKRLAEW